MVFHHLIIKKVVLKSKGNIKSWSAIISSQVEKLMDEDEDIVVITPAMISGSCLGDIFKKYPNRSFDVWDSRRTRYDFCCWFI